jgi:UDP-glucose 4-epimerase
VNPMSILVTGGAGYIGSHMVYELADAGERGRLDDLFVEEQESNVPNMSKVMSWKCSRARQLSWKGLKYFIYKVIGIQKSRKMRFI